MYDDVTHNIMFYTLLFVWNQYLFEWVLIIFITLTVYILIVLIFLKNQN